MNSRMMEMAEREIVQDTLLEALEETGSMGMSLQVIEQLLKHQGVDTKKAKEVLWYMESKGWVIHKDYSNERQGVSRIIYFITAKGIDHLDGKEEKMADG